MSNKPWRCRFGIHKFVFVYTPTTTIDTNAAAGAARTIRGAAVAHWTASTTSVGLVEKAARFLGLLQPASRRRPWRPRLVRGWRFICSS